MHETPASFMQVYKVSQATDNSIIIGEKVLQEDMRYVKSGVK
jgi:hypothetical protein